MGNKNKQIKDFEKRLTAFLDELGFLIQKHKIDYKAIITQDGPKIKFLDIKNSK